MYEILALTAHFSIYCCNSISALAVYNNYIPQMEQHELEGRLHAVLSGECNYFLVLSVVSIITSTHYTLR